MGHAGGVCFASHIMLPKAHGVPIGETPSKLPERAGVGVFYPYPNPELIDRAYRIPWAQKLAEPKAAFGIRSEQ